MTLHGVTDSLTAVVALTPFKVGIRVHATFVINLKRYKINRPKFLFMKLNENQAVTLDLFAKRVE